MNMKGSKTEKNLLAAFAGESQARNRYTFASSQARKEGFEQIAAIFLETAENEKEHAKLFFGLLEGGIAEVAASYPAGVTSNTAANLKESAEGEKMEWGSIYPDFAQVAEKEGFTKAAQTFRRVALVEAEHEKRYRRLLKNVENSEVFSKSVSVKWHCRNCGYVFEGKFVPDKCPVCDHSRAFYEVLSENY